MLVVPTFWLLKVKDVGERLAEDETPVPLRLAVWGLPAALSLTVSVAVRVPVAVGVNVTLIVQLPPAAMTQPSCFAPASIVYQRNGRLTATATNKVQFSDSRYGSALSPRCLVIDPSGLPKLIVGACV